MGVCVCVSRLDGREHMTHTAGINMTRHTYKKSYFQYEEVTITSTSQQVSRMDSREKKGKEKEK